MPLKLHVKSGQQIIVNGAVIENVGARTASLLVKNEAAILRDNDIITPDQASTPASRVYFAVQCLYLFPDQRDKYLPIFNELADNYVEAAPSSASTIETLRDHVREGRFYAALKDARQLITHEGRILSHAEE